MSKASAPVVEVATARHKPIRIGKLAPRLGLLFFIGVLAYLIVLPLVRLQILAFGHGARAYSEAFSEPGIWKTVWQTVELALGSLAIALILGTALAWASTMLSPKFWFLRILPILPIVVPAIASVLGWSFLFSPHPGYLNTLLRHLPWWHHLYEGPVDIYTLPWILIITGLALTSFIYLFVSAGFENINGELLEAAQVSGSTPAGVFFRVTLPLLRPSLIYGGGVALLLALGQFTAPLLLGANNNINVLTTEMYRATQQTPAQYDIAAALGSPLLVFGVIVLVLNKYLLGDVTRFVTHGGKAFRPVTRSSPLAASSLILYGLVATVLPIVGLALVSLQPFWSGTLHPSHFTLGAFRSIFHDGAILTGIRTSLITSVIAVAITLPLGYLAATALRSRGQNKVLQPVLDVTVALPLSIPAVIFGVGFLFAYTHAPFVLYGTKWVLVLVYITLMVPFATRMQLSGMTALGNAYVEASRVSGAGPIRTHLRILAPLMRGTFAAAAALMFILLANEFAASLLVRAPTQNVMGTILYNYYGNGLYPQVAATALVMVAVTAGGVLVAMAVGGTDIFKKL